MIRYQYQYKNNVDCSTDQHYKANDCSVVHQENCRLRVRICVYDCCFRSTEDKYCVLGELETTAVSWEHWHNNCMYTILDTVYTGGSEIKMLDY